MTEARFYPHASHPGRLRRDTHARKTSIRRAPRTAAHLLPFWHLSFDLPEHVGAFVMSGFYPGIIGVSIGPGSHIEIKGKNTQWLRQQMVALLRQVTPDGLIRPLTVELQREDQPSAKAMTVSWNGREARIVMGTSMTVLAA